MRCLSIVVSLCLVITISLQDCPDGWRKSEVIPNKCYYVGIQKKTWFDAEASCQSAQPNAHLTSITSAFENSNVEAVVISTPSDSGCGQFWIGGNDIEQTGQFEWVDGSSWGYARWGPGQPDYTQQCVSSTALQNGQWKTEPCGAENCFICEMYMGSAATTSLPPTTTPSTTTSARTSTTTPSTTTSTARTMTDCKDWFNYGAHTDGIYSINPDGRGSFNVFCDMTTDGGGWTVFQRRIDGTLSFHDKVWYEYKVGFKNGLESSLWLGNDIIHVLTTKDVNVELRIDLWGDRQPASSNPNGYWWEKRSNFYTDDEANFYTLHLSSDYSGNATMMTAGISELDGKQFATIDALHGASGCFSDLQLGGWWMSNNCAWSALNGKYVTNIWGFYGFFWNTGFADINPVQSQVVPNKCYYVGSQKETWFDAEASCQSAQPNAHLTSITSAFENSNVDAVVTSTPSDTGCGKFWIGGNDIEQSGQFAWVDGSSWGYTRWGPGQPDTTQQCVTSTALQDGQWKTEDCGDENCFICEMYMGISGNTSLPPTTTSSTATSTMPKKRDVFGLSIDQDEEQSSSCSSQMRRNIYKFKAPFAFDFTTAIASETIHVIDDGQTPTSVENASDSSKTITIDKKDKEATVTVSPVDGSSDWSHSRFDTMFSFSRSKDSNKTINS
uniref:Uncharacterized protein n=1 Tax=Plectus sambesii TaxID=2011161 RepID=A0A914W7P0_9BILA